ncbi:MAG: Phosphoenolpyruvate-dependent sugar phosphotransferase system, EIIA 2 [Verrucomicrobia bacterium ADurb.Bin474]|nr:MAG: Phosphoenolpyruvate-dependent sugar phosphotransferase system, EIIA 2 [Verrucomicrobia bacterium ADurb.Bin474]
MYLNIIQIAESFGVSEKVIQDWIQNDGLPCIHDRNRLVFDRARVAEWAAEHGLGKQAGFLSPQASSPAATINLRNLLEIGGIWRDIPASEVMPIFERALASMHGVSSTILSYMRQRIQAPGGITYAPIGDGIALPHPSTRTALGKDSGIIALLLLREPFPYKDPTPDDGPILRMLFFIAPSPRAHLDMLAGLSRKLASGPLKKRILEGAADDQILDCFNDTSPN